MRLTFGKSDTYVLMIPKESIEAQRELSNELHTIPQVISILSYVDTVGAEIPEQYLDEGTLSKLNSKHFTRMVLSLDTAYEGTETFALVQEIRGGAEKYYPGEGILQVKVYLLFFQAYCTCLITWWLAKEESENR